MRNPEWQGVQQRFGRADKSEGGARVVVEKQQLAVERREALVDATDRRVMGLQVRGRKSRNHADRRPELHRQRGGFDQRRFSLRRRVGQPVAPARSHVETDIAEQIEAAVETFVGIAFLQQSGNVGAPFLQKLLLDIVTDTRDVVAVFAREIQLLERRVHLLEVSTDPAVEFFGSGCHGLVTVFAPCE